MFQACDTSGRCWTIRLCDICVRIIASETPAPAPAPAGPPAHKRAPEDAPTGRSIADTAWLDARRPFWPLPFANVSTDRPRPSTRPTRTSEAALWTRRRRGGAAGGTPGRIGEARRVKTLVPKIRSCWLNGNAPLSTLTYAHGDFKLK